MQTQDSKLHSQMALIIKSGKKKMFKRLREGMGYGGAVNRFIEEMTEDLTIAEPDEPEHVTATLTGGEEINLYGDAVDLSRRRDNLPFSAEQRLANAVHEIINNDETPTALYDAVTDFVVSGVNNKNAEGETLLDRWAFQPETIKWVLRWAQEAEANGGAQ